LAFARSAVNFHAADGSVCNRGGPVCVCVCVCVSVCLCVCVCVCVCVWTERERDSCADIHLCFCLIGSCTVCLLPHYYTGLRVHGRRRAGRRQDQSTGGVAGSVGLCHLAAIRRGPGRLDACTTATHCGYVLFVPECVFLSDIVISSFFCSQLSMGDFAHRNSKSVHVFYANCVSNLPFHALTPLSSGTAGLSENVFEIASKSLN
jgi:hypothetical protein